MKKLVFLVLFMFCLINIIGSSDTQAGWKDKVKQGWDKTKSKTKDKWDSAKSKTKDKWDSAKSKTKDKWDSAKSKTKDYWDNSKDKFRDKFDETKRKFQEQSSKINPNWSKLKNASIDWKRKAESFSKPYLDQFKSRGKEELRTLIEASNDGIKRFKLNHSSNNWKSNFDKYLSNVNKYNNLLQQRLSQCPEKYIRLVASYISDNPTKSKYVYHEVANFVGFLEETKSFKKAVLMEGVNVISKIPVQVGNEVMDFETYCQNLISERVPFLVGTDATEELSDVVMYGLIAKDKNYLLNDMKIMPSKNNSSQKLPIKNWFYEYADIEESSISEMVEVCKSLEILNNATDDKGLLEYASHNICNISKFMDSNNYLSSIESDNINVISNSHRINNPALFVILSFVCFIFIAVIIARIVDENKANAIPVDENLVAEAIPVDSKIASNSQYNSVNKKTGGKRFLKFVIMFIIIFGILFSTCWFGFYKDYYKQSKNLYTLGENALKEGYIETALICFDTVREKYEYSLASFDAKKKIDEIKLVNIQMK